MTQYDEKQKYENAGMSPLSDSYRVRHDKIDFSIKEAKRRVEKVRMRFIVIDALVVVPFYCFVYYLA